MQDFGLAVSHIEVDTPSIRRVKYGQKKNNNGFYRAWSNPGTDLISGIYGTYSPTYQIYKFESNAQVPTFNEAQKFQLEKRKESNAMVEKAFDPDLSIWDDGIDVDPDHPYLRMKKIKAYGLKQYNGMKGPELLVPLIDEDAKLKGVQRITSNGGKFFVKNTPKKGCFHRIDGNDVIAICEGYATGATIAEATGWTVLVCFDCGNMRNVARKFRTERLIVCADDDYENPENPGLKKAKEIRDDFYCPMVYPKWVEGDLRGTDFNDLGLDKTTVQLAGKDPKSFLDQLSEINDPSRREDFIIDRREYIAQFPKHKLVKLKSDIKRIAEIPKSFVEDAISGIVSDVDQEVMEDAKEDLKKVRYDGKSYFKLSLSPEGDKYYRTTQQEVTILVNLASGDDERQKQILLDTIHRDKIVSEVSAEPMPYGRSHIKEFLSADGSIAIRKMISTEKCIESRLEELADVEVDESFIQYIMNDYPEVVDIMEASLARKFCESRKSFVYLNCNEGYGKTFFFGLESLGRSFSRKYDVEEFRGNDPEDFIKPLFLFIDEADCFPAEYKVNEPQYKRLYGGYAKVKLGLRILACANVLEDVVRGVDPQIQDRVVSIQCKEDKKKFSHQGIEKTLSRKMFEKWILNRLGNLLLKWSDSGDVLGECEKHFDNFVEKYNRGDKFTSLADVLKDHLEEILMIDTRKVNTQFDFTSHLYKCDSNGDRRRILITSPSKFFKELFKYLDEDRSKAFFKHYKSISELNKISFLGESKVYKFGQVTRRGMMVVYERNADDGKICLSNVTETDMDL